VAYLFDTNAISEVFRRRPNAEYVQWLLEVPREEQYTSAVVVGELYVAAFQQAGPASRSPVRDKWLRRIEERVVPAMTVLPFDLAVALEYGRLRAHLLSRGREVGSIDMQIAATALLYDLTVVTANGRHFRQAPKLRVKEFRPGQPPT